MGGDVLGLGLVLRREPFLVAATARAGGYGEHPLHSLLPRWTLVLPSSGRPSVAGNLTYLVYLELEVPSFTMLILAISRSSVRLSTDECPP